jgi:hypothetical protein
MEKGIRVNSYFNSDVLEKCRLGATSFLIWHRQGVQVIELKNIVDLLTRI